MLQKTKTAKESWTSAAYSKSNLISYAFSHRQFTICHTVTQAIHFIGVNAFPQSAAPWITMKLRFYVGYFV